MGLPIFREPQDASPVSATEKVDRAASASRRSIRRQSTLRPYRERAAREPSADASDVEDGLINYWYRMRRSPRPSRPRTEFDQSAAAQRAANTTNLSRNRTSRSHRNQIGEQLLLDALQHERPGERLRRPRQFRESGLRFELDVGPPGETNDRSIRGPHIPSPPYSSSGSAPDRQSPNGTLPSFTVGFAPAFPVDSQIPSETALTSSFPPRIPSPPSFSAYPPFPRLRRTRSLRPLPHVTPPNLDFTDSSSDSDMEENTWDTLLTTMEPDEHLPSTSSSFTTGSASASNSQSIQSSQSTAISSLNTLRPTEATAGSTYCPQSPSGTDDDASGDDGEDLAPAPPQELIQRMNRRAAAATHQHRRIGPGRMALLRRPFNVRESQSVRASGLDYRPPPRFHMEDFVDLDEPNSGATVDTTSHMPVILDGNLRSSPRPVDGPLTPSEPATQLDPLDEEIRQELQRDEQLLSQRLVFPEERSDQGQREPDSVETQQSDRDALGTLQRVIERMARRDDIPEEWWAAIGLRRSF